MGTPFRFAIGPGFRALVIADPEVIDTISRQRPKAFARGGRLRPVRAEMGFVGVFSAEGATWITQRRPVTGALSAAHLPGWLPSLTVIMRRVMTPFSHGHWVRRPADRRLDRAVAAMQDHARACIRAARAALDPDTPPRHAADVHRQHPAPRLSCRAAGQRRAGRGAGPAGGECR